MCWLTSKEISSKSAILLDDAPGANDYVLFFMQQLIRSTWRCRLDRGLRDQRLAAHVAELYPCFQPRWISRTPGHGKEGSKTTRGTAEKGNRKRQQATEPTASANDSNINWFQQTSPAIHDRCPADPDFPGLDEDQVEIKWLKENIDRLDNELKELTPESFAANGIYSDQSQESGDGARKSVSEQIQSSFQEKEGQAQEYRRQRDVLIDKFMIRQSAPYPAKYHIERFNKTVRNALVTDRNDEETRKNIRRAWYRAKVFVPELLKHVPRPTWDLLLALQTHAMLQEEFRWARRMLSIQDTMTQVGLPLLVEQKMLRVEALLFEKEYEAAHSEWKSLHAGSHEGQTSTNIDLLGIRLFTTSGDASRAQDLAEQYLARSQAPDHRILLPLIDCWVSKQDKQAISQAWSLYLRLRLALGGDFKDTDYDRVSLSYLRGHQSGLGLAVFKDMMLSGQTTQDDSLRLYHKVSAEFGELHAASISVKQLKTISLENITALPKRFRNKFFFASWMKKLIGMQEVEGAAALIQLMYEHDVVPDARHVNGVIGAWFRGSNSANKKRAEKIAWAMIISRIDQVKARMARKDASYSGSPMAPNSAEIATVDIRIPHRVPPASNETFCLLLRYYRRHRQPLTRQQIINLEAAYEMAQMAPDSRWLNHGLYLDLRQNALERAWNRFCQERSLPDLHSFFILWHCEKESLSRHQPAQVFPSCRHLMASMYNWLAQLRPRQLEEIQASFTRTLHTIIIRSFVQAKDLFGTIIVLHFLRDVFGFYPNETTEQTVLKELVRSRKILASKGQISNHGSKTAGRRVYSKTIKQNDADTSAALKILQQKHMKLLIPDDQSDAPLNTSTDQPSIGSTEPISYQELTPEIRFNALIDFIGRMAIKSMPPNTNYEQEIEKAMTELGIEGLELDQIP